MAKILKIVLRLSQWINVVSQVALAFMMCLTVADVILRSFRRPIIGTYELVAFSGAVVIGFSLPLTSWVRGHVDVDIITSKLSRKRRDVINIVTRCLAMGIFFLIGWNLIKYALALRAAREVSMTLQMPFYPIAYGLGICVFVQCLVLLCDVVKIFKGTYEERGEHA
jgi:TRAP-type C4-dicarboxylate transport system permease small subunit